MTRLPVFIIAIALVVSFFRLGSVTLFDVDEAVFAEATKEMVQSGNWVTPTYNGANRYDKPILFYWLMALSYKTFGINEFGARFPSALAAFLVALSIFLFVRRCKDDKKAFYAAIPLAVSIYYFVYSHASVTDMTLTLFITLSIFSFYISSSGKDALRKGTDRYLYGFYFFSALAFLTKGLIGIIFPFGIVFVYLLLTEGLSGIRKAASLKGLAIFLIVSAPWYGAQLVINGQEFIQQFFIKHHVMRYSGVISGHKGPFYYYIPALLLGLFPWIAFLPAGIRDLLKEKDKLGLLALVWFAFIVLFFSFSTTKLPNYILPSLPAAAIIISFGLSGQDNRWRQYAHVFIIIMSLAIVIAFFVSRGYLMKLGFNDISWTLAAVAIMFSMAVAGVYALFAKKRLYGIMSGIMLVFLAVLSIKALPLANRHLQGTLHKYSLYAKERLPEGEKIVTYGINNPSIVFYSGRGVVNARSSEDLIPFIQGNKYTVAIAKTKDSGFLKEMGFSLLESDGRYAFLERK